MRGLFAALLLLLLTACNPAPRGLLRLGTLAAPPPAAAVALPAGSTLGAEPVQFQVDLDAARIARLTVRAKGTASLATLSWRLAQDPHFPPYRTLSFPLNPDGQEHLYEVDLGHEAYWTGRVVALRLSVSGGSLDLLGLSGKPGADLYRSMSLKGESLPALPGLSKIELPLPKDLPRGARFESRIGLVPEVDRPGARAVFRAALDGRPWFEEVLTGSDGEGNGWRKVGKALPAGSGGRHLTLSVEASRNGNPLPEGVALWGDPLLVLPGRTVGKNLIVILIDTLRADALGVYGGKDGLTPHLDAFARSGLRFAHLMSPAPWTLPSVASLVTGLQPQTHGAGQRFGNFAPTGLPAGATTMAEVLRDRGFYTLGVYHNIYVNPAFGLEQGFDEYAAYEDSADVLVDQALARLKRYGPDRRLFLYLHLFDAHNPYAPPEPECTTVARRLAPDYRGPLGCTGDRRPENPLPPEGDRPWFAALYKAEVAFTDRQVGRFLAGLHDLGLDRDTVVAVLSDHGEEFWQRLDQEQALGYEVNGDHGHTHYQELLHVPALIRVPGRAPAVLDATVQTVDLFPTLLHLAGVEPPPSQGKDLVPLLDGAPAERETLISDLLLHGQPRWAVRRGPWKLVVPRVPNLPVELYNLETDPGERQNLAPREQRIVADLKAFGEKEMADRAKARGRYLQGSDSLNATYLEWNHITKLRSLGYLR
ncbi:MAG TPA: sulfatase [Thermoanaerobaculia bacterium]|nr:sulfatase [Thermoanaerobaculia bacterium]